MRRPLRRKEFVHILGTGADASTDTRAGTRGGTCNISNELAFGISSDQEAPECDCNDRARRARSGLTNDPDGLGGRMSGAWWNRSEIEEAEVGKGEGGVMYFCTRPP